VACIAYAHTSQLYSPERPWTPQLASQCYSMILNIVLASANQLRPKQFPSRGSIVCMKPEPFSMSNPHAATPFCSLKAFSGMYYQCECQSTILDTLKGSNGRVWQDTRKSWKQETQQNEVTSLGRALEMEGKLLD